MHFHVQEQSIHLTLTFSVCLRVNPHLNSKHKSASFRVPEAGVIVLEAPQRNPSLHRTNEEASQPALIHDVVQANDLDFRAPFKLSQDVAVSRRLCMDINGVFQDVGPHGEGLWSLDLLKLLLGR